MSIPSITYSFGQDGKAVEIGARGMLWITEPGVDAGPEDAVCRTVEEMVEFHNAVTICVQEALKAQQREQPQDTPVPVGAGPRIFR